METRSSDIGGLRALTYDRDPRVWRAAVTHLCPCHVKRNHEPVWERMVAMATDPDAKVRNWVLHVLTDGSPRSQQADVVRVLQVLHDDPEPRLRRKARKILAEYRRTGNLNVS